MLDTPTLGNGDNEAVVYERGGSRRLFTVPAVAKIEWNRTLDAVSRATVSAAPGRADSLNWSGCCDLLSQVHPWAHEVVFYRSGERVWEGPVRRVVQNRAGVQIVASDVLGWGERRVQASPVAGVVALTDEAAAVLTAVFSGVVDNVLPYVEVGGTPSQVTTLDVKAGGYWAQVLAALVTAGLSYTTIGRRIVVWDDPTWAPGMTAILNPERHLIGDVETAREGDDLAVDAYAVNDDGEVGSSSVVDDFYGDVQRLLSAPGIVGPAALSDAAARWQQLRYPAPESLTLPSDSTLHCEAPFPIGVLVPGVLTPVKVNDLCWPVEQTMMLTEVKVTQDSNGEKVGVTYAPITGTEET